MTHDVCMNYWNFRQYMYEGQAFLGCNYRDSTSPGTFLEICTMVYFEWKVSEPNSETVQIIRISNTKENKTASDTKMFAMTQKILDSPHQQNLTLT